MGIFHGKEMEKETAHEHPKSKILSYDLQLSPLHCDWNNIDRYKD
jgi:hypothetical protein